MTKLALLICVVIGASLGAIAGSGVADRKHAWGKVSAAADELTRSEQLRGEVDQLRTRFVDVKRDLDAAQTPAAATAARAKLFQLRVDMVAIEDELSVLARRRPAAHDL